MSVVVKKEKSDYIFDNLAKITSLELLVLNGNLNLIKNIKNPHTFLNMYHSLTNLKWLSYEIYYRKNLDQEAKKYTNYITDVFHTLHIEELNICKGNYAITKDIIKQCIKNKHIKSKLKKKILLMKKHIYLINIYVVKTVFPCPYYYYYFLIIQS